jgi:type II secretory pathway pseudopilin PulG
MKTAKHIRTGEHARPGRCRPRLSACIRRAMLSRTLGTLRCPRVFREGAENSARGGRAPRSFLESGLSLIELIGVLAVVAIVAILLVPAALRHLDQLAIDRETVRLKALGEAMQGSILRTHSIPNGSNWVTDIGTQSGLSPNEVSMNSRRKPRILLIDPSGWLSTNLNLPYRQDNSGTPNFPANARMILVSSLGASLPVGITTGFSPSAGAFNAVWNWPDGTNAPPEDALWAGWLGSDDLVVRRINLSPLIVRLALTTYNSDANGQYGVVSGSKSSVPPTNGITAYFLKGTVLNFYGAAPGDVPDGTQVLDADASYVYEAGKWRDSVQNQMVPGVDDVSGLVAAFLAATPNTNAQNGATQQVIVVQSMMNYLSNYNAWAALNFPSGPMQNYLKNTVQPALMSNVNGLYGSSGSQNFYPTNAAP